MTYRIKDWSTRYETHRTRELKRMDWVPIPNRMDGLGYAELVDHPQGAAHLGAWLAIVEIASRQEVRGTFSYDSTELSQALARISRIPAEIFEAAIPRLVRIGWVERIEQVTEIPRDPAPVRGEAPPSRARAEGKGMELNGTEGNGTGRAPISLDEIRLALIEYPGAKKLPGTPDDKLLIKIRGLAGNDVDELARGLRALSLTGKKPELSWGWFPTVLKTYLRKVVTDVRH